MSYLYYLRMQFKKLVLTMPGIFLLFLVGWWIDGTIASKVSLPVLIGIVIVGVFGSAFIKYKNNGKDLLGLD